MHVDSPTVYTSEKSLNLSTIDKIHLKCNLIDDNLVKTLRQTIFYSFVLNKPPRFRIFSEPETMHYEKTKKSVLNTITFYLEDDNQEKVNFKGKQLTFTLQLIKI